MSDDLLDEWLTAAGFDPEVRDEFGSSDDDPWGAVEISVTSFSDEQRAFLLGGSEALDSASAEGWDVAEREIIDIPVDPDDVEPFD